MRRVNVDLLLMCGVAVGIGVFVAGLRAHMTQVPENVRLVQMPSLPFPTPTPLPVVLKNQLSSTSWPTPDGSKTLIMKSLRVPSGVTTYSFFVGTSATQSGQPIFTQTVAAGTTMTIPFNTWSPDNRYFFIQEQHATASDQSANIPATDSLVFKTSGEKFPDGSEYLDITALFNDKKSGYELKEVTGWAAPTLLIVNTKAQDTGNGTGATKPGPSFWFEITRKSLIRLSTSFE